MLPIIVLAVVVGVAWRVSYWPFDRSYKYLPKYGDNHCGKGTPPSGTKPAE